ncbi:MAG TPA: YceD family protein [Pseudomonadales bacterium]
MRTDPLPERVDFRRLAAKQVRLSGDLPLKRLARLAERLLDTDGIVQIDAEFDRDASGRYCLTGQLKTGLPVRCERCLEPMVRQVDQSFCLAAVWSEDDASQLPDEYDPWVTGEDPVSLVDIVEEELLLSLPLVNYHETPCMPGLVKTEEECVPAAPRQNPFQALEALRKKT